MKASRTRRVLAYALRPLLRLALRWFPPGDPWERLDYAAPLFAFGSGARRDFDWYFEGESAVTVASLEEVHAWLATCEYASDPHLFQEPDFWQHPRTFEHLRRGDCEDYALWAWRKLVELGHHATLVVGCALPRREGHGRHAWLLVDRDGVEFLYEPGWRDWEQALRPLDRVKTEYLPEFGVGPDRRRFSFGGYLHVLRERELGARTNQGEIATSTT